MERVKNMSINPMMLMKFKEMTDGFNQRHPKLQLFLRDVAPMVDTGAVLELSITSPDGVKKRTNIRVTEEDKELLDTIGGLLKQK